MIGRGPTVLIERALEYLGIAATAPSIEHLTGAFVDCYAKHGNTFSSLYAGGRECLETLAESDVAVGVCSNKPHHTCRALFADLGIEQYVGAWQGSVEELPKKPHPAMLLEVLQQLNVPADNALYVGDSDTDVRIARAAGMPVVLVSYGYTDVPASQLAADGVIDSLAEVPAILRRIMPADPQADRRPLQSTTT
jgi:phosphoglycolate phosphatase